MLTRFLLLLLFAFPVEAAEVIVKIPDAFLHQKVEQLCNMKKSVDCENKPDGQILTEIVNVIFQKIGYKTDFGDMVITVEYDE